MFLFLCICVDLLIRNKKKLAAILTNNKRKKDENIKFLEVEICCVINIYVINFCYLYFLRIFIFVCQKKTTFDKK